VAGSATASSAPNDDLRNAIEASVLADPRVANIPPEQLQGLIVALIAEAQAQHMTAADIMSRPVPQQAAAGSTFDNAQAQQQSTACLLGWQGYLCNFNKVFGFDGNNHTIPIFLLCVTAFLIAVIWELIIHHRKVLAKEAMARAAGTQKKIDPVAGSAKPLV
jgi:hypothetical protein